MPFADGVPNLLRYLFNLRTDGPDHSNLPVESRATGAELGLVGEQAEQEFLMFQVVVREDLEGVIWWVQAATSLTALAAGEGEEAIWLGSQPGAGGTVIHNFRSPFPITSDTPVFMNVAAALP
ncbi:MAG: hypothetical protein LR015_12540 [Verrucomicrobia bacterium]|nr:hypothetical protein [Verrucomicrobiota bacterium]